jgi:TRAP-type mannitol/chloroaromatic compound transport system permease large subunit
VSEGNDAARRRRSGNPAVRAGAADPRPTETGRERFERSSLPWLLRLAAVPRWALVVVVLVAAILGLLLPGIGGALVLLGAVTLAAWLTAISWPVLRPGQRAARILILLLFLADAVIKVVTR